MLSDNQIEKIRSYFSDKPVNRAFVFGSHAKNTENEESDIDLLVELDYTEPIGLYFITMKLELEELLSKPIDMISENGLSKLIRPFVEKSKRLIYEAG